MRSRPGNRAERPRATRLAGRSGALERARGHAGRRQDEGARHRLPQGRVWREHAVVAMAVAPGRRDECRELVDQLQRRERQRRGAFTLWFGQPVEDRFGVEQLQTLQCERRPSTIAQQPLQPGAIVSTHAYRGIQREPAVGPGGDLGARISRTSSGSISPLRANHRSSRMRTCSAMAAIASGVSSAAGRKRTGFTTSPASSIGSKTPSMTQQWYRWVIRPLDLDGEDHRGPNIRPHGHEWQPIMRQRGAEPTRCHDYDVSGLDARRLKYFDYHCSCMRHQLSSIRHNKVAKGQRYLCKRCGEPLRRGGEV